MTRAPFTQDEFDAWRDEPVTQFVFAAARKAAELQKTAWADATFDTGVANQELLTELRARADAYRALEETTLEQWLGVMEEA